MLNMHSCAEQYNVKKNPKETNKSTNNNKNNNQKKKKKKKAQHKYIMNISCKNKTYQLVIMLKSLKPEKHDSDSNYKVNMMVVVFMR